MEKRRKSILISGSGRSGTTYLYLQLVKNFENTLYEPLNPTIGSLVMAVIKKEEFNMKEHPYLSKKQLNYIVYPYLKFFGEKVIDILKQNPNLEKSFAGLFYSEFEIKNYLIKYFKDFHIKEQTLVLYLRDKLINKYWEPYHIIRHPIDVFMSSLSKFYSSLKKTKILHFQRISPWVRFLLNRLINYEGYSIAKKLYFIYGTETNMKKIETMSIEESFLISWIISNYQAVSSIPKDHVIVYEKPETYKRLPFELKDPLRIKIYPKAREDLSYKFEKIAKKWDLDSEYNYLLKLFD